MYKNGWILFCENAAGLFVGFFQVWRVGCSHAESSMPFVLYICFGIVLSVDRAGRGAGVLCWWVFGRMVRVPDWDAEGY